jgi:hypothetical protein
MLRRADPPAQLAIRTAVAVVAGGAGLLGPDAGAAVTALTPAMERVAGGVSSRALRRDVGRRPRLIYSTHGQHPRFQ